MIFSFVFLCILMLFIPPIVFATNKKAEGAIHKDYLTKESTLSIKGFFVLLVFFSHFRGYAELSGSFLDVSFNWITNLLGQLIVAMFFFYSGFGIFESYKTKGNEYVKGFLLKRFLPTWISFAICICFFIIENAVLGNTYSVLDLALSFTGWSSIGNSNWFMFVTFALYILFFLVFFIFKKTNNYFKLSLLTIASCGLLVTLYIFKDSYWYNTLLCFVTGAWYSLLKDRIDKFISKSNRNYFLILTAGLIGFVSAYLLIGWHGVFYCVYSTMFGLLVVLMTMKIKFRSFPLSFVGKHVFSIYILQRLVFSALVFIKIENPYRLFFISLLITIVISYLYDNTFDFFKTKLFNLTRNKE